MREKIFQFKHGPVAYIEKGKGRTIFLLHGYLESKAMWHYYIEMLSPYFRVIAIDLPGHGNTGNYGYVHTMDMMADCIHAAMRFFKLRKIFLVGHSMGGYAALAFAEFFPDNLAGLCLLHSTAYSDHEQKQKDRDRAIVIAKKNPALWINEAIPNLFYREHKSYAATIQRYKRMAKKTSLQGMIAGQEGMKIRPDRSIILKFAPYPVLIIAGEEDQLIPLDDLMAQSQLAENTHLIKLEDVGHMGIEESPDKIWTSIKRFVLAVIQKKPISG